jgi:contractile injection system tube protein
MPSGFSNQAKILRGAFVEFGVSQPPLIVAFQFNPVTITRTRSARVNQADTPGKNRASNEDFIKQVSADKLFKDLRNGQNIIVAPQTLGFDIRLDATDKLNDGDPMAQQFGIAPQLSTLELMMLPKNQSLLGGSARSFSFADEAKNPPVTLFIWGRKKVMPVNIKNMTIKEEEFSIDLHPIRATVTVSLEVIEGPNAPFLYTKAMTEAMSLLNPANVVDLANAIVPA